MLGKHLVFNKMYNITHKLAVKGSSPLPADFVYLIVHLGQVKYLEPKLFVAFFPFSLGIGLELGNIFEQGGLAYFLVIIVEFVILLLYIS